MPNRKVDFSICTFANALERHANAYIRSTSGEKNYLDFSFITSAKRIKSVDKLNFVYICCYLLIRQ